jgi:uncharacterized protein YdhG (YjbR/CyaY superfamily)
MSRQLPINGKYGVVDFAATYRKVLIAVSWQELSADQLRETAHFFNQLAEIIDGDKPTTIDQYIATFPKERQLVLEQLRVTIKNAVPFAEETISYGMPAFKYNSIAVWFAGYNNHIGLYPMYGMEQFTAEMEYYKGKGTKDTLRFAYDKALPLELITRLVQYKFKQSNNA